MFSKLFALLLLAIIFYWLAIFFLPQFADTYGDQKLNSEIRLLKKNLDNIGGTGATAKSLVDSARSAVTPYVQDSQKTASGITNSIDQKIKEAQKAADSVKKAYKSVEQAADDVSQVTTFWSGSSN